jgi:hypothetical protein
MKRVYLYFSAIILVLLIIATLISIEGALKMEKPKAPLQPLSGPGGADYKHGTVEMSTYGDGENQYWIYEPGSPQPESAPVIIFMHGWGATTPTFYEAWIEHLVRKGNIVIYPRYQENIFTPSDRFTPNSIRAVKEALNELQSGNHVLPQINKTAMVGHSAGGLISVNIAALAESEGLPTPRAVFAVEPGKSRSPEEQRGPILQNLTHISPETLLLTLSGDQDTWVGDQDAIKIIRDTNQISSENKDYLLLVTDEHGNPALVADHFAPLSSKLNIGGYNVTLGVDAMDYYGTWKLFDGLYEAAFYGENRTYALGNTSHQRFMGFWSDGTPVKELEVSNNP